MKNYKNENGLFFLSPEIMKLKINDKVQLHSFNRSIYNDILQCDIVINPVIQTESFGLVIIEAFALKVPVISSSIGGAKEIISNEQTGILIQAKSPQLIVDAIIRLYKNKKLYDDIKDSAFNSYTNNFTSQKMVQTYYDLIK